MTLMRARRARAFVLVAAFAFCQSSLAQQFTSPAAAAPQPRSDQRALTNEDVITMARAGLSEALIITSIRQAKVRAFALTPEALIQLKSAGVSESILTVMLDPAADVPYTAPAAVSNKPDISDNPATAHDAGIYVDLGKGEPRLVQLEPTVFSEGKTGGIFASKMTYGLVKEKWKAVVRGKTANQRIQSVHPFFYFYFELKGAGLSNTGGFSGWMAGASSPNEFLLARMDQKSDGRELIVGQSGSLGASSGARSKDVMNLKIEKLSPGIYRVSPSDPLTFGAEYCFFYAGGPSAVTAPGGINPAMSGGNIGKLFDFGVDADVRPSSK